MLHNLSFQTRTSQISKLFPYTTLFRSGSPSYYAQKMFSTMRGDEILATDSQNIPTREWRPRDVLRIRRQNFITDRKSTRLNSSHPSISYAVFCLKKKIYVTLPHTIFTT